MSDLTMINEIYDLMVINEMFDFTVINEIWFLKWSVKLIKNNLMFH